MGANNTIKVVPASTPNINDDIMMALRDDNFEGGNTLGHGKAGGDGSFEHLKVQDH